MKKQFGQFGAFIGKEFLHIFRDWWTVLILLGMPIAQITLFGFAISTEINDVRMVVVDPSKDVATRQIVDRFASNGYFTIVDELASPDGIDEVFRRGGADMALIFGPNFLYNLSHGAGADVQVVADGIDPNLARVAGAYVSSVISSYNASTATAPPEGIVIVPQVKLLYNPQLKSAYNFVPGVMGLILTLICAMMTAVSIVREKERGTMEIMLVSPMKPINMIIAKMVPYLVISAVSLTTIILLAVFVLGVPLAGGIWTLSLVSILFIIVSLSLGLLISSLVSTQVTAMLLSGMVLMMPVSLLSGMIFPVESMPGILQWISAVIPARWYIAAMRKVMNEGLGLAFVLKEAVVLTVMAAVLITASLKSFKNRLA